jgi:arginyl-tRNA--protein-N-Asp/Glu arginylyltransferase
MEYLHWDEKTITDFSDKAVADMYAHGYVFTRKGKGVMQQTRSCRIDLSKFELSSENRRILKKTDGVSLSAEPLPYAGYDFKIGKLAKDFYDTKFGAGTMSANKIKELMTDATKSNFNSLLHYAASNAPIGYAICYSNASILHYSFPFYNLTSAPKDMGLGMMIRAIEHAKSAGMKYIYLGSLQRPGDTYKLQFSGLEWFDGKKWQTDIAPLKEILK